MAERRGGEGSSYGHAYDSAAPGYDRYYDEIEEVQEEGDVDVSGAAAESGEIDSKSIYDNFMELHRSLRLGPLEYEPIDERLLALLPPKNFRQTSYGGGAAPRPEAPKGFVPLLVGKAGEQEESRYIVPAHYLKHRVFIDILDRSVQSYLDSFMPHSKHRLFHRSRRHQPPKDAPTHRGELKLDCDIATFERLISRVGDPRCVFKANPSPDPKPSADNSDPENEPNANYIQQSIMEIFGPKVRNSDVDYESPDRRPARDGRLANVLKKPRVARSKMASPAHAPKREPSKRRAPAEYQLYPGQLNKGKALLSDIIEGEEREIEEEEEDIEEEEEEYYDKYGAMASSSNPSGKEPKIPLLVGPDSVPFGVPKRYLAHPLFKELLLKCAWEMPSDPEVLALPSIDALAFEQFISLVEADDLAQAIEFITFDEKQGRTSNHGNLRQRLHSLRKDLIPKIFNRKNKSDNDGTNPTNIVKKPAPRHIIIPKHVPVLVGEHVQKRFEVPTSYLKEPIFKEIVQITSSLDDYQQRGILSLSCDVEAFEQLLELLDRKKKKEKASTSAQH